MRRPSRGTHVHLAWLVLTANMEKHNFTFIFFRFLFSGQFRLERAGQQSINRGVDVGVVIDHAVNGRADR